MTWSFIFYPLTLLSSSLNHFPSSFLISHTYLLHSASFPPSPFHIPFIMFLICHPLLSLWLLILNFEPIPPPSFFIQHLFLNYHHLPVTSFTLPTTSFISCFTHFISFFIPTGCHHTISLHCPHFFHPLPHYPLLMHRSDTWIPYRLWYLLISRMG